MSFAGNDTVSELGTFVRGFRTTCEELSGESENAIEERGEQADLIAIANELLGDFNELADFVRHGGGEKWGRTWRVCWQSGKVPTAGYFLQGFFDGICLPPLRVFRGLSPFLSSVGHASHPPDRSHMNARMQVFVQNRRQVSVSLPIRSSHPPSPIFIQPPGCFCIDFVPHRR
jgi:hypothetical protein